MEIYYKHGSNFRASSGDWPSTRAMCDGLESWQQGRATTEGQTTQKAQRVGFNVGRTQFDKAHPLKSMLHPVKPFPPR